MNSNTILIGGLSIGIIFCITALLLGFLPPTLEITHVDEFCVLGADRVEADVNIYVGVMYNPSEIHILGTADRADHQWSFVFEEGLYEEVMQKELRIVAIATREEVRTKSYCLAELPFVAIDYHQISPHS